MNVIDYIIAKRIIKSQGGTPVDVPENVTEEDINKIEPPTQKMEGPIEFERVKKRPHTVVPDELIPENIKQIPELASVLEPIAQRLANNWTTKENIENEIKAINKKAKEDIAELKAKGTYNDVMKEIEKDVNELGNALAAIDAQSDVILRRYHEFFIAIAKQMNSRQDVLMTDKEQLEFVLGKLRDADTNLSRSIKLKLNYALKKATVTVQSISRYLRLWPIPEVKQKKGEVRSLIAQVEDDVKELAFETLSATNSFLSDLYTLDSTLQDAISSLRKS